MDPFSLVSMQHLSSNALAKGTADLEFVAKFGELWATQENTKVTHHQEESLRFLKV